MIDQIKFVDYMQEMPQKSTTMKRKLVIKANEPYNSHIVTMSNASQMYIDQLFFRTKLNDHEK